MDKLNYFINKFKDTKIFRPEDMKLYYSMAPSYHSLDKNPSLVSLIKTYLSIVFYHGYNYTFDDNAKIIFFFSNSYFNRIDYLYNFSKLTALYDSKILILPNRKFRFSIHRILKSLILIKWFILSFRIEFSWKLKLFNILNMLHGYLDCGEIIDKIDIFLDKKLSLVTFCDNHSVDLWLVHSSKKKYNTITITLQHGHYSFNWVYIYSLSDYMLVFGEYNRQQAISICGNSNKFISVGLMQNIGETLPSIAVYNPEKPIGLILSGKIPYGNENYQLVLMINKLCEEFNLFYTIRFHPSLKFDDYEKIINQERYIENDNKQELKSFLNGISFGVLGKSTVFIECHGNGTPCFRFVDEGIDIFQGIDYNSFSKYDEFKDKFQGFLNNPINFYNNMIETKKKFIQDGEAKENYYNAIHKIVSKK